MSKKRKLNNDCKTKKPAKTLDKRIVIQTIANQTNLIVDVGTIIVDYCDEIITPALVDTYVGGIHFNKSSLNSQQIHKMFVHYLPDALFKPSNGECTRYIPSLENKMSDFFGVPYDDLGLPDIVFFIWSFHSFLKDVSCIVHFGLFHKRCLQVAQNKSVAFEYLARFLFISIRHQLIDARALMIVFVVAYLNEFYIRDSGGLEYFKEKINSDFPFPSYIMEKTSFCRDTWSSLPYSTRATEFLKETRTQVQFLKEVCPMKYFNRMSDLDLEKTINDLQDIVAKTLFLANVNVI